MKKMYEFTVTADVLRDVCFPGSVFWEGFAKPKNGTSFYKRFLAGEKAIIKEMLENDEEFIASAKLTIIDSLQYESHSGRPYTVYKGGDDLYDHYVDTFNIIFFNTDEEEEKGYVPQVAKRMEQYNKSL